MHEPWPVIGKKHSEVRIHYVLFCFEVKKKRSSQAVGTCRGKINKSSNFCFKPRSTSSYLSSILFDRQWDVLIGIETGQYYRWHWNNNRLRPASYFDSSCWMHKMRDPLLCREKTCLVHLNCVAVCSIATCPIHSFDQIIFWCLIICDAVILDLSIFQTCTNIDESSEERTKNITRTLYAVLRKDE